MNILNNKTLLVLPGIIIISLILISFLFFTQINKLKSQIDNLYFGTFVPVHKLHTLVSLYNKMIMQNKLNTNERIILKNWNYYYTGYKTKKEKIILSKINKKIIKTFQNYDKKLLINIVTNLENIIKYEIDLAYVQRKDFLYKYYKMSDYLIYSLILILVFSLILVSIVIFFSLQKHTELEKLTNKYKADSITDGLTELYNRKYFDLIFSKITIIAHENKWKCSFIMLDIDFFKPYNDNYGHQQGDEALKEVAKVLNSQLHRTDDYLFRIGGEEFAIILYDTTIAFLHMLSDKIHKGLKESNIKHDFNEDFGRVTISMGVFTALCQHDMSKFEIYDRADKALYESKENGRSQTTFVEG